MKGHGNRHIGDRLQAWLDGELREAEAEVVRKHIAGCAGCSRAMKEMKAVVASLQGDAKAGAEPLRPMWPAVRAAVSREARPRFGLSFGVATSLAAAAGVLIGMALGSTDGISRRAEGADSQYTGTILGEDYALTLDEIYTSVPEENDELK